MYGKNACIYNVHVFTAAFLGKELKVRSLSLVHVILYREFPEYLSPFCSRQDFQGREPSTFLFIWVSEELSGALYHIHTAPCPIGVLRKEAIFPFQCYGILFLLF